MSFEEAIAQQPAWIGVWLNVLLVGAFVLPLVLIIWRRSRLIGIVLPIVSVAGAVATSALYDAMGYVKLLGLPHIIVWTPALIWLVTLIRRPDMPRWPRRIMVVIAIVIGVSLAFDYVDVIRYTLGERMPQVLPATDNGS
ncbi:MAG: hypothetical protein AAF367_14280 [Pseudomonadota bacterium]